MDALERATQLQKEAGFILQETGLLKTLQAHGRVFFSGSYFLNVMVYPDVDLLFTQVDIPHLFQVAGEIALSPLVWQVVFEKSDDPALPGGLYLKARLRYGDWGRPWKIDIWSLEESLIAEKMRQMQGFKDRLTPELRQQIIRYKDSIMTAQLRTPMYSGYFIYKAFIDEKLSEPAQVTRYLIANGIQMG